MRRTSRPPLAKTKSGPLIVERASIRVESGDQRENYLVSENVSLKLFDPTRVSSILPCVVTGCRVGELNSCTRYWLAVEEKERSKETGNGAFASALTAKGLLLARGEVHDAAAARLVRVVAHVRALVRVHAREAVALEQLHGVNR